MTTKEMHNGAKNGGGHWGTRHAAKTTVKRAGRRAAKQEMQRSYKEDQMLTEEQVERFIEITSDHVGLDAEDVIATRDTLDSFVEAQGKPYEIVYDDSCDHPSFTLCMSADDQGYSHDDLYVWHLKHQGRLYVTDFGDVRAACLID
jgi:hypothetical protein